MKGIKKGQFLFPFVYVRCGGCFVFDCAFLSGVCFCSCHAVVNSCIGGGCDV